MPPEKIRQLILSKYSTQKEFAQTIGIGEGNLSHLIKKPTPKFIALCARHGIKIKQSNEEEPQEYIEQIKNLKNAVKTLNEIIQTKDKIISQQEKLIQQLQKD